MLARFRIPKTILWVINLFLMFLLIFTLFRLTTYFAFKHKGYHFGDYIPSFIMGLRFDLRWISFALLPIVVISMVPQFSPFYSSRNKKWWTWYLAIVSFIILFFFIADFGSFRYNYTRIDAGALNFWEDLAISTRMLFQSYPMVWMILGLISAVMIVWWLYKKSHWHVISRTDGMGIPYRRKHFVITGLILGIFAYGSLTWPPLLWNNSFVFHDSFKTNLALNPLQNFFTTLRFRRPEFNEKKARDAFPMIAELMQFPDNKNFSFRREVFPRSGALESRPNIVLVQCESFSMYKSSMSGNPMDATPYFKSLTEKGIFFERCFTPHFSTARGIFAILTGIPDAQLFRFSTRNPLALKQHTIINNFEGYSKHYFLGGDPDFNNFVGLLKNIDSLHMHTEGSFKSPKINVWGISDKDLFMEANDIFKQQTSPFFAYVQLSGNHKPYIIPAKDTSEYKRAFMSDDSLHKYGFESLDEYNILRYYDYCFKKFIETAQNEEYFHNTIFVFVGDHGVAGNAAALYPRAWTEQRLTDEHVPLLFYAPYLLTPQTRSEVVSQIDVLPTIAGMVNQPYINTTLGRDLLDPTKKNNFAFITNTSGTIGMVTDEFYYLTNFNFPDNQLVSIKGNPLPYTQLQVDSIEQKMSSMTMAYFETARYLLMNNKKD